MPARRQLFPEKLWDLVDQPASGIQWSPDGKRIQVDRTLLEKFDGTKFRSHNFDSFIRQLHFYGFRKTGNSYYHAKFQRGQPEALVTMKRKYSHSSIVKSNLNSSGNKVEAETSDSIEAIDLTAHKTIMDYANMGCRHKGSQGESKNPSKIISKPNQWFRIEFN